MSGIIKHHIVWTFLQTDLISVMKMHTWIFLWLISRYIFVNNGDSDSFRIYIYICHIPTYEWEIVYVNTEFLLITFPLIICCFRQLPVTGLLNKYFTHSFKQSWPLIWSFRFRIILPWFRECLITQKFFFSPEVGCCCTEELLILDTRWVKIT